MIRDASRVSDQVSTVMHARRDNDSRVLVRGHVIAELFDEFGNLKSYFEGDNIVTAVGDRLFASRSAGLTTSALPTGMRLGTGSTAVAKTGAGAAIVTYLPGSNKAFDATFPSEAGGVVTYKRTYAAGEATTVNPITEAVINTDTIANDNATTATAANTIARILLSGIGSKGASDILAITWTQTALGA